MEISHKKLTSIPSSLASGPSYVSIKTPTSLKHPNFANLDLASWIFKIT